MPITPAGIKNARFQATLSSQCIFPVENSTPIAVPLYFSDVANVMQYTGTYTPNNDYRYLVQGLSFDQAFNFMIIICDRQLSLACSMLKSSIVLPVQRFGFFSFIRDAANHPTGCFIDGRLNPNPGNSPMPQNVAVNYQFIIGQATIA